MREGRGRGGRGRCACYPIDVEPKGTFGGTAGVRAKTPIAVVFTVAALFPVTTTLLQTDMRGVSVGILAAGVVVWWMLRRRGWIPKAPFLAQVIVDGKALRLAPQTHRRGLGDSATIARRRIVGAYLTSGIDGYGSVHVLDREQRVLAQVDLPAEGVARFVTALGISRVEPPKRIRAELGRSNAARALIVLPFVALFVGCLLLYLRGQAHLIDAASNAVSGTWNDKAARAHEPLLFWPVVAAALSLPLAALTFLGLGHPSGFVELFGDGLRLSFGRKDRFVPIAELASVDVEAAWVWLNLRSGERVRIVCGASTSQWLARTLTEKIATRASRVAAPIEEQLAAQGAASRGTALGPTSASDAYRAIDMPHDALWTVVEDAGAPAEARAVAALALRRALPSDAVRPRMRVAADDVATPRLRVALDAAATVDDDALDHLVAAVDAVRPARRLAPGT